MSVKQALNGVYDVSNQEFLDLLKASQSRTILGVLQEKTPASADTIFKEPTTTLDPTNQVYGLWPQGVQWRFDDSNFKVIVTATVNGFQQDYVFTESYFRKLMITYK